MSWFVVDVESDGPIPVDYSMVSFGAVLVEPGLTRTFFAQVRPLPGARWLPEALAVVGVSRAEHEGYEDPAPAMARFVAWVKQETRGKPTFASDNNGFDWQWMNWYLHHFAGENPFGYSSRRIADLWCGMARDVYSPWKHLRRTASDHNPVNDAKGNAEALLAMQEMGLGVRLD